MIPNKSFEKIKFQGMSEGRAKIELVMIYEVPSEGIAKAWMIAGNKTLHADAAPQR